MAQPNPTQTVTNPRIAKLIELEQAGRIKPEHQQELDTYRAQGLAPKKMTPGSDATVEERKASSFLTRALGSQHSYEGAETSPRTYIGQKLKDSAPDMLNSLPAVIGNSPERQVSDSAQDEFIAATLRQDSGAAIPPAELEAQRRIYFPMPGDGPDVIKQKRAARLRAISGLMEASGRSLTAEQKKMLDAMKPDMADAMQGEKVGASAKPEDGKTVVSIGDAAHQVIDEAAGLNSGPMKVNITDATSGQSPEFRAGLEKLLNEGASKQAILEYWDKNAPGAIEKGANPMEPAPIATERGKDGIVENADALVRGVADTATLGFADEIAAAGDTIFGDGTMAENLKRQRGVDRYDEQVNPWMRSAGQIMGAVAPVGLGRIGIEARTPLEMGTAGATVGGIYGVGSGDTLEDRFMGGVKGAAGGAAAGLTLGKLAQMYRDKAPPITPGPTHGQEVKAAADRLDIPVMPADVGGPMAGRITSGVAQTPFGVNTISKAAAESVDAAKAARDRIAGGVGQATDTVGAGESVHAAADIYRKGSSERGGRLYDRARDLAGNTQVDVMDAALSIDERIQRLEKAAGTNGPEIAGLKRILGDIAETVPDGQGGTMLVPKKLDIQTARDIRTGLRTSVNYDNLRGTPAEAALKDAVNLITDNMYSGLTKAGKGDAANAFKAADKFWAGRVEQIDKILAPIIGRDGAKSDTAAFEAIERLAGQKGDPKRLSRLMAAMPDEEANTVRATIISRLGQAKAGAQNDVGDVFSPAQFVTNWNNLSSRSKAVLFDPQTRSALDDLAKVTGAMKSAQKYANTSNTAGASSVNATTGGLGGATVALFTGHPIIAAALASPAVGQKITAKMMTSPVMVRWLTRAPANQAALREHIARLSGIAARNPQLANDIGQLSNGLMRAVNDNAGRAAASDGNSQQK